MRLNEGVSTTSTLERDIQKETALQPRRSPSHKLKVIKEVILGALITLFAGDMSQAPNVSAEDKNKPVAERVDQSAKNKEQSEALAEQFFNNYLANNNESAKTLYDMREFVAQFRKDAPIFLVRKCIDERQQGPHHKGWPAGLLILDRSEGVISDTTYNNADLWNLVNDTIVLGQDHYGMPAIILVSGHTKCAAHQKKAIDVRIRNDAIAPGMEREEVEPEAETNARAQLCARDQIKEIVIKKRDEVQSGRLFAMAGMTDTNNLGMTLYGPYGDAFFDANDIIRKGNIDTPASVFHTDFLTHKIEGVHESIDGKTIGEIFGGNKPLAFNDDKASIAIEAYLLKKIKTSVEDGSIMEHPILNKYIQVNIDKGLNAIKVLPSIRGFMTYMLSWNIAHAVYRDRMLVSLEKDDREAHTNEVEHNAEIAGFGKGFYTLRRGDAIVIKLDNGALKALDISRTVLDEVYRRRDIQHAPLVHVNIELEHGIGIGHQLGRIPARMKTKIGMAREIYGNGAIIMPTYSYHPSLQSNLDGDNGHGVTITSHFFPFKPDIVERNIYCPEDLGVGLSTENFGEESAKELRDRERGYVKRLEAKRENSKNKVQK